MNTMGAFLASHVQTPYTPMTGWWYQLTYSYSSVMIPVFLLGIDCVSDHLARIQQSSKHLAATSSQNLAQRKI